MLIWKKIRLRPAATLSVSMEELISVMTTEERWSEIKQATTVSQYIH